MFKELSPEARKNVAKIIARKLPEVGPKILQNREAAKQDKKQGA